MRSRFLWRRCSRCTEWEEGRRGLVTRNELIVQTERRLGENVFVYYLHTCDRLVMLEMGTQANLKPVWSEPSM